VGNLASALDELLAVDVRGLPDEVLVEEIVELDRAMNRCQAADLARLEVLDRRGGMASRHGSTAAWLRGALRLSPSRAYRDVHLARDLADVLPNVAAAMADGDVSATHAQVLAGLRKDDAAISRIISGPLSEILDAGRTTRTFTAAQRRAIVIRDQHCIWPGCDAPPAWCDAHHIVHWADGGPTSVDNGVLLCGRHHDRLHHHGHAIVKDPDTGQYKVHPIPGTDPNWRPRDRAGP
jgi:hypothetical protein